MGPDEIQKKGKRMAKSEFNKLCRAGKIENAQKESFGDGYGEPYYPVRLIFGYLNKKLVWAESNDNK